MRILALSDNHGSIKKIGTILKQENFDIAIHLGDSCLPEKVIKNRFAYYVSGNNDSFYRPYEILEVENTKILCVHGHQQFVWPGQKSKELYNVAKEYGANIVLHGHTHVKEKYLINNVLIVGCGSPDFPRMGDSPGYVIIDINKEKIKVSFKEWNEL